VYIVYEGSEVDLGVSLGEMCVTEYRTVCLPTD